MAKTDVQCRFCKKPDFVYKHGIGSGGHSRFRCTDSKKTFQLDYTYTAHKEGIKEQVVTMAMNGSGVRDTSRVLGIGFNTALCTLKTQTKASDSYSL